MHRLVISFVVLAVLALPTAVQAATIVVDTTELDSPTKCGLWDAIDAAYAETEKGGCAAGGPTNRIEFASSALPEIVLTKPLPEIRGSLEIVGPGKDQLTISGADSFRVFAVGNLLQTGSLSIADLTIADGLATEIGAGLLIQPASAAELTRVVVRDNEINADDRFAEGAGIMNFGDVTLTDSTVVGNVVRNANLAAKEEIEANGGGISSGQAENKIVLDRSTVSGNSATVTGSTEKGVSRGGGIFVNAQTKLFLRDSTVSGNVAEINAGPENLARGGGVALWENAGEGTIESSTIAANTGPEGANFFAEGPSPTTFRSTIVAQPLGGPACGGPIISLGYNLDEGSSCGFAGPADQSNVAPRLATQLAFNGGPTETLALLNGSPAVDRGLAGSGETSDQRGFKRPAEIPGVPNAPGGDGSDIGAFEVRTPPRTLLVRGPGEGTTITDAQPIFDFLADGASAGFVCSIDGAAASACSTPFQAPSLGNGRHSFTVAALGEAGYAGEAATRTFTVDVRVTPPRPQVAPRAKIQNLPAKTTKRRLTIRFSATQSGSTFQCKLDKRKWRRCQSPYRTPKLKLGNHAFKLRATGSSGLVQQKPTTKKFRVVAPRPSR